MSNTEIQSKCGSYAGYVKHIKSKTPPCTPCSDARREYRKGYREMYPDRIRSSNKEYADTHREIVRAKNTRWRVSHPEYFQAYNHKRRANLARVNHAPYSVKEVLDAYGELCHLCGQQISLENTRRIGDEGWETSLHLDHVIPVSKGGEDTLQNIRPAHGLCNSKKYASYGDSL